MRRVWYTVGLLGAILGQAGCKNDSLLRPPKQPEEFRTPPEEQRYLGPPQTPKEAMNPDGTKTRGGEPGLPTSMSRPGGRSGIVP